MRNSGFTAKGLLGDRLRQSPRLQRAVEHVHACGPRPTAELLIELLERAGADPAILEHLPRWQSLDPRIVRQLGGDRWPRAPLDVVPPQGGKR